MSDRSAIGRISRFLLLTALLWIASVPNAGAQGFIGTSIGYNFGGDAGCLEITNCEEKNWNWAFSIGALGSVAGFEAEFLYAKDFFGEAATQSTDVLTFMGNFMLAPKFGPVQPYGLVGFGLIRTKVETADAIEVSDDKQVGWDIGGGLLVFFGQHVGVRGDIRYYHSFEALDILGLELARDEEKLDFGRAALGVVLKF